MIVIRARQMMLPASMMIYATRVHLELLTSTHHTQRYTRMSLKARCVAGTDAHSGSKPKTTVAQEAIYGGAVVAGGWRPGTLQ